MLNSNIITFRFLVILAVAMLGLFFGPIEKASAKSLEAFVDEKISKMSLEQKVGQLFLIGLTGDEFGAIQDQNLNSLKPGGLILFKRNISTLEKLKEFTANARTSSYKYSNVPLFIAVDQEGGNVNRVPMKTKAPSALSLGQLNSPPITKDIGEAVGGYLKSLGININLAPVLDPTFASKSSFIGSRGFNDNFQIISSLAFSYAEGLLAAGVVPVAKHFPGTAPSKSDPHVGLVDSPLKLEELKNSALIPYQTLAKLNPIGVMTGHTVFRNIDPSGAPASSSSILINDVLRQGLNFNGLVITDDLQMGGATANDPEADLKKRASGAALKSLLAGADMVLMAYSFKEQKKAYDTVLKAAKNGSLSSDQLNIKVRRILMAKAFINVTNPSPKTYQKELSQLAEKKMESATNSMLDQLIANSPFIETSQGRSIASENNTCLISHVQSFSSGFKKDFIGKLQIADTSTLPSDKSLLEKRLSALPSWLHRNNCDKVLITLTSYRQAAVLKKIPAQYFDKSILINLGQPLDEDLTKNFVNRINFYTNLPAVSKKLAAKFSAGAIPVNKHKNKVSEANSVLFL